METSQIINVIAIIIIPIVAVLIGQLLQERSKKRDDKMWVFKALMTTRVRSDINRVHALNIIDIVFADSKEVRECCKSYLDTLRTETFIYKASSQAECMLLEAIAKNLGYKKIITWKKIQSPYYPVWLEESVKKQNQMQDGYSAFLNVATQVLTPNPTDAFVSNTADSEKR